ncbi:MAG: HD domain-containing phosphohydrolase [Candidatus Sedimenticola sp. 6PFRAG7]
MPEFNVINPNQLPGDILIVDDTPASLRLLSGLLTDAGYKTRPANSGELALQSAFTKAPELILLDIRMPGIDGYEVCRRLKENESTREIPVIFISALDDIRDRVKGFEVGGVDYISKPFQQEEVMARVRTHLELQRIRCHLEAIVDQRTKSLHNTIRTLRTLSAVNQSLVHATEEQQLLQLICDAIVSTGGYRMVWVGYAELKGEKPVRSMAHSGVADGYLDNVNITWDDSERGRGPTGTAIRTKEIAVCNSIIHDPSYAPWSEEATKRGYASSIALPLLIGNECIGALNIYASSANRFDDADEIRLLSELTGDLAFGIQHLRSENARHLAEEQIVESYDRLQSTLRQTIQAMAITVEKRDPYTAGHQRRVTQLAEAIAERMELDQNTIEGIRFAGSIHDVGKIYVPSEILNRPGRLSATEFSIIQTHPTIGYEILKDINFQEPVAEVILQHHERMDGSGYPQGLSGNKIMLQARIIAVADVVEAIASHRPYRPSLGIAKARAEIEENRGRLYDPEVVDTCLEVLEEPGIITMLESTPLSMSNSQDT